VAGKLRPDPEKEQAAEEVVERRVAFENALENKHKYPMQEFDAFLGIPAKPNACSEGKPNGIPG
jgi:hypothetical protein